MKYFLNNAPHPGVIPTKIGKIGLFQFSRWVVSVINNYIYDFLYGMIEIIGNTCIFVKPSFLKFNTSTKYGIQIKIDLSHTSVIRETILSRFPEKERILLVIQNSRP
jgi:hypothetical protein